MSLRREFLRVATATATAIVVVKALLDGKWWALLPWVAVIAVIVGVNGGRPYWWSKQLWRFMFWVQRRALAHATRWPGKAWCWPRPARIVWFAPGLVGAWWVSLQGDVFSIERLFWVCVAYTLTKAAFRRPVGLRLRTARDLRRIRSEVWRGY